ncbi:MAG TPA: hypothetical protein VGY66_14495 [Gemmataceae bacterium]|jgi:hypothetical protein|nr:hypothetical protein [Gemmataceae bacterium]
MRRAVLVAVALYIAAHFLPAYQRGANPQLLSGWQISSETMQRLFTRPSRWILPSTNHGARFRMIYVAWLANPLFCFGVAAVLVTGRAHPRLAGAIAAAAGTGAVACTVAYAIYLPPVLFSSIVWLPGCYLWIISLLLLTTIGLHQILVRREPVPTPEQALAVASESSHDSPESARV